MANVGIEKKDVFEVAEALSAAGLEPTIKAIGENSKTQEILQLFLIQ